MVADMAALAAEPNEDGEAKRPSIWPHVEERYSVDPHGIVEVTITDLGDGYSRSYVLGERTR